MSEATIKYYTPIGTQYYHIMRRDGKFTYCNLTPSSPHRIVTERPTARKQCKRCGYAQVATPTSGEGGEG